MSVRDITDWSAVAKAFANTYGGERDGWERVQEYQRVLEYTANHPNRGSSAVSSALDLPRGRIRPWMESGAKPDPMNGLQELATLDWVGLDWEQSPFWEFNILVSWIFAGGSVTVSYVPFFAVADADQRDLVESVLVNLNLEYRLEREDEPKRATEVVPREHATILGRMLLALGAPFGEKNPDSRIELPTYLSVAPASVRLNFARTYVWLRGIEFPDRENQPIMLREDRSPEFKRELRAFLRTLTGPSEVTGSVTSPSLYLSPEGARILHQRPDLSKPHLE